MDLFLIKSTNQKEWYLTKVNQKTNKNKFPFFLYETVFINYVKFFNGILNTNTHYRF